MRTTKTTGKRPERSSLQPRRILDWFTCDQAWPSASNPQPSNSAASTSQKGQSPTFSKSGVVGVDRHSPVAHPSQASTTPPNAAKRRRCINGSVQDTPANHDRSPQAERAYSRETRFPFSTPREETAQTTRVARLSLTPLLIRFPPIPMEWEVLVCMRVTRRFNREKTRPQYRVLGHFWVRGPQMPPKRSEDFALLVDFCGLVAQSTSIVGSRKVFCDLRRRRRRHRRGVDCVGLVLATRTDRYRRRAPPHRCAPTHLTVRTTYLTVRTTFTLLRRTARTTYLTATHRAHYLYLTATHRAHYLPYCDAPRALPLPYCDAPRALPTLL
jgi:hypothetical protein